MIDIKGMKQEKYSEIVSFVQKYHKFASIVEKHDDYPKIPPFGFGIKYIDCVYDTRFGDVWSVTFRGFEKVTFSTNILVNENIKNFTFDNLYDWIMAYLKGEWNNKRIMKILTHNLNED